MAGAVMPDPIPTGDHRSPMATRTRGTSIAGPDNCFPEAILGQAMARLLTCAWAMPRLLELQLEDVGCVRGHGELLLDYGELLCFTLLEG